ncbi:MAG: hypothetical protein AAF639_41130 [Chloroflexota bacterium]
MSTSNAINKSRVVLVAFIALLAIVLSTISGVYINGADVTAQSELPAIAAGNLSGSGGG